VVAGGGGGGGGGGGEGRGGMKSSECGKVFSSYWGVVVDLKLSEFIVQDLLLRWN